jgi:hypothetical protein
MHGGNPHDILLWPGTGRPCEDVESGRRSGLDDPFPGPDSASRPGVVDTTGLVRPPSIQRSPSPAPSFC